MVLLDENKKSINLRLGKVLGKGAFGEVYRINKEDCFKFFLKRCANDPEKTLTVFRDNDFCNFYKVKNLYFNPNDGIITGYKMKFYSISDIDLHTVDSSYIIESYLGLLKDIEILSKNGITLCDFSYYNMLLTKNGIIGIDADLFNSMRGMSYEKTYLYNLYQLKLGLVDLLSSQYRNSNSIDKERLDFGLYCAYLHRLIQPMENSHDFSKELVNEKNLDSYMRKAL